MRIRRIVAVVPIALLAGLGPGVSSMAQSLADVARQEDARRKVTRGAAKVYTNGDLVPVAQPAPSAASSPAGDGGLAAASKPPDSASDATPAAGTTPALVAAGGDSAENTPVPAGSLRRDEAYWRGRLKALRDQVEQNQSYAQAMQSRVDTLTRGFIGRADSSQRVRVGVDRQKAIADLDRLKLAMDTGKKAIADLEEEARRAGAPAGWLR